MCNMCIIYIICYLNFLNICLTVRHIFLLVFFFSLILFLPPIFNYYYQLCSLIFNIFGLSRTWWWYHTTPTIFTLRLRVLLKFTFGDMTSFSFCFLFSKIPITNASESFRHYFYQTSRLQDIFTFFLHPHFMSRYFCSQFGIFPLCELMLIQL